MKTFLKLALFCGLFAVAIPASAQLHIGVGINIGPPPPRKERMIVRPSRDAVWIAGYYKWHPRRHRYVWVPGRWMRPPRPHTVWVEGRGKDETTSGSTTKADGRTSRPERDDSALLNINHQGAPKGIPSETLTVKHHFDIFPPPLPLLKEEGRREASGVVAVSTLTYF